MKLFQVTIERDGSTTKGPGVVETELVKQTYWYVAQTIQEVWQETEWLRNDPERYFLGIHESLPAVTIISKLPAEMK